VGDAQGKQAISNVFKKHSFGSFIFISDCTIAQLSLKCLTDIKLTNTNQLLFISLKISTRTKVMTIFTSAPGRIVLKFASNKQNFGKNH
jgi:hypothetical protein